MTPPFERLSSEERRQRILDTAVPLFASRGFNGTTTKDLAKAAGISEALLYKHFPSKEALFRVIQEECVCGGDESGEISRFEALPPSTEKLIFGIHVLVHTIVFQKDMTFCRLMGNSLLSDGDFARQFLENVKDTWWKMFQEALKAARRSGDIFPGSPKKDLGVWFAHHVAVMTNFLSLPDAPAVEYGVSREELARSITLFALRGIGLSDSSIEKHYDAKKFAGARAPSGGKK